MPDILPLQDLSQQISQHESELERLRQEYEARRSQLADLARRKEELRGQLKQVEAEILAVKQGNASEPVTIPAPVASQGKRRRAKLPALLVKIVGAARGPVTVKELTAEVQRRKFPTTSGNIPRLVGTRVGDLVQKGVLRRLPGQTGVVLAEKATSPEGASPEAADGERPLPSPTRKGKRAKKGASKRRAQTGQPTLRSVLADLFKKSRKPIAVRELAEQALAGGYQTTSKNFKDVIWVNLRQMDNVENVPGKGYRLKR